jgi:hypothetical protein
MKTGVKKGVIISNTTYGDAEDAVSWTGTNKWSDDLDAGLKSRRRAKLASEAPEF